MSGIQQPTQNMSNPSGYAPDGNGELPRETFDAMGRADAEEIWASRLPLIDFVDHNIDVTLPGLFYDNW